METPTKLSFSPSNILARLEELKRWQVEQEERLKLRQAQQREVLSAEQRRMCEAFELTNNTSYASSITSETNCYNDSKTEETEQLLNTPEISIDELRGDSNNDTSTNQEHTDVTESQINISVSQLNFDEIPIKSVKQQIPIEKSVMYAQAEVTNRPKFKFLKRGTGLSRYRMTTDDIIKNSTKTQSKPNPKSTQSKNKPKVCRKPDIKKKIEPVWKTVSGTSKSPITNTWKASENIEHRPNPQPYPVLTKDSYEKLLDELKIKRDRDELKIFEFLEQKADNSSFCSTNSVLKNLPDNSTPKLERLLQSKLGIIEQNKQTSPQSQVQRKLYDENIEDKSLHVRFVDGMTDEVNSEESSRTNSPENYHDQIQWSDTSENEEDDENKTEPSLKNISVNTEIPVNQVTMDEATEQMQNETDTSEAADDVVFKSHLLKKRLLELENEIQTFRKENSNIIKRRQEYDHLKRVLLKEKTEKEKLLADEKLRMDKYLEEEKRKLAREKMVFEKYVKETKNQPTRKEREEIIALKDQVRTLKEEIKVKETKYGATQARLRTQIRTLEKEVANAKGEIEKLQKENRRLSNVQKRQAGISNTKVLHEINKNISKMLPKALAQTQLKALDKTDKQCTQRLPTKKVRRISENCPLSTSTESEDESASSSENTENQSTSDESDDEQNVRKSAVQSTLMKTMYPNSKHSYFPENTRQKEKSHFEMSNFKENDFNYANMESNRISIDNKTETRDTGFETCRSSNTMNPSTFREKSHEYNMPSVSQFDSARSGSTSNDIENVYERTFGKFKSSNTYSYLANKSPHSPESQTVKKDEKTLSDGYKEVRYANGNVKTVSPDGNIIKLTYYNGDLKETNLNTGVVKYYYAETKTSHTTFPDGFELLEFRNGQTEKRFKNGRIEVDFPNGYRKVVDVQGNETWYYSDGTVVITKINGDKIIELPNGQKEIHNQDHKRREYPDGTVKVLYPDGATETRYASGRVRIKDKTGLLIMDTEK